MTEFVADNWLLLLVGAATVLAIALWFADDAPVARRVYSRFILIIALPLSVLLGAPLVVFSQFVETEPRVLAAVVAGVVIASGWLTTAIFRELGRSQDKSERLRDYHKAIYAEIGNALRGMWDDGRADEMTAEIVDRMTANKNFVPFIPKEHHDHVFNALLENVEVLPRQTIDAIVAYYSVMKSISALADDMRGDSFRQLEQSRRIAIYEDYSEMRRQAFLLGQFTLELIATYADSGPDAASKLSIRAAVQSDRSRGSE